MSPVATSPTAVAGSGVPGSRSSSIRPRLDALDHLRGVVMVLMALDHVRDFFSDARFNPVDLTQTNAAVFLTRWVTHFCAPVFVFLAGTGAFLAGRRGKTRPQLAWFLLTRGAWLVVLEFTLVHLGWCFAFDYNLLLGQVIWALGWSMVALAGLIFLPTWAITALGFAVIVGHNALDGVDPEALLLPTWLVTVLLRPGVIALEPGRSLIVAYPILPWLGIMLAGYGFGALWLLPRGRRRGYLVGLGTALVVLFALLRTANIYGDPQPWSYQSTGSFTVLSFLNCTKYPPSLQYVLMTLGPAMLGLAWWDRQSGPLGGVLVIFGRVPLFYYLLHVPVIHLVAMAFAYARYGEIDFLFQHFGFAGPGQIPADYGYGLPMVYAVWIGVIILLYPPCRWFAEVKRRHSWAWLSYL
jgi:uncharacterized membrane protein